MRVVVRTTTGSPADSTPADPTATTQGTPASETAASESPATGGGPAPPIGDTPSSTGSARAGGSDAEGTESRPRRVPTEQTVTCHGYSEGEHGLKLTDADGEKCGYVPYAELLRIVPE